MTNRIRDMYIVNHRLDPHETELRVHVEVENLTPTTEIKGRLIGPRSAYATTVEIAYPMREVGRGSDYVELRVVIPEACWWEPKTPFLYQGAVELLQDGQVYDHKRINHGIRRLQMTSQGVRLNGRPFILRAKAGEPRATESQVEHFRVEGFNGLMVDCNKWAWSEMEFLWPLRHLTDRHGIFVLVRSDDVPQFFARKNVLEAHASVFGWIVCGKLEAEFNADIKTELPNLWLGVESNASPMAKSATFQVCLEADLSAERSLPKVVLTPRLRESLPSRSDVIGWIELP